MSYKSSNNRISKLFMWINVIAFFVATLHFDVVSVYTITNQMYI